MAMRRMFLDWRQRLPQSIRFPASLFILVPAPRQPNAADLHARRTHGRMMAMWEDPIVSEVHQARERLAAEFHFDVAAIFADLQRRQESLGPRLVRPRQKPPAELESTVSSPLLSAEARQSAQ
jgi:hypothetical protein